MASGPKLLARVWLPGQGCRYLRSPGMSDAEALGLIEAARGTINIAQETGALEEVAGTTDRVFVLARRTADPDHPQRSVPGFVLTVIPDVERFIQDAVADRLRAVPDAEDISSTRGWEFLDLGATSREIAGDPRLVSRRGGWCSVVSRVFRLARLVGFVTLLLVIIVAYLVYHR